ncbi:MAG: hypothetical protein AABW46_02980 [Nanoarchaeota archaeon]
MKRGISLFLIYLILTITFSSSIVTSQDPTRARTILDKCTVDARSNTDTIQVTLRATQSGDVIIHLYDPTIFPEIGDLERISITKIKGNNIYNFSYQNKEYATDHIILQDICFIDEKDTIEQRASSTQAITLDGPCYTEPPLSPNIILCRCVDQNEGRQYELTAFTNPPNYDSWILPPGETCPDTHSWQITLPTTTDMPDTEDHPIIAEETEEELDECKGLTKAECENNQRCSWTSHGTPPSCSDNPIESTLATGFNFIANLFTNFLIFVAKTFAFLVNGIAGIFSNFRLSDPEFVSLTPDCSEERIWNFGECNQVNFANNVNTLVQEYIDSHPQHCNLVSDQIQKISTNLQLQEESRISIGTISSLAKGKNKVWLIGGPRGRVWSDLELFVVKDKDGNTRLETDMTVKLWLHKDVWKNEGRYNDLVEYNPEVDEFDPKKFYPPKEHKNSFALIVKTQIKNNKIYLETKWWDQEKAPEESSDLVSPDNLPSNQIYKPDPKELTPEKADFQIKNKLIPTVIAIYVKANLGILLGVLFKTEKREITHNDLVRRINSDRGNKILEELNGDNLDDDNPEKYKKWQDFINEYIVPSIDNEVKKCSN